MRVMLLGSSSPVGRAIALSVARSGAHVVPAGRSGFGPLGLRIDLADRSTFLPALREARPDVLIHAAYSHLADATRSHHVNVQNSIALLEDALDFGVSRIVFISSAAVYGDRCKTALSEEMILSPSTSYARNKADVETRLIELSRKNLARASVIRPFNVFGPALESSLINRLIQRRARLRENPFAGDADPPVGLTRGQDFVRDYVHVRDVASLATRLAATDAPTGIYNSGSGNARTNHDLVRELQLEENIDYEWKDGPSSHSWADMTKTLGTFGEDLSEKTIHLRI